MRVIVNVLDVTSVRHGPRVAPHYRLVMRWLVSVIIGRAEPVEEGDFARSPAARQ